MDEDELEENPITQEDVSSSSPEKLYWTALRSMKESVRTSALKSLRELHPVGAEYLCRVPPALWNNSTFPVETWDEDTSNLGEQQVNWVGIRDARSEPGVKFVSNLILKMFSH